MYHVPESSSHLLPVGSIMPLSISSSERMVSSLPESGHAFFSQSVCTKLHPMQSYVFSLEVANLQFWYPLEVAGNLKIRQNWITKRIPYYCSLSRPNHESSFKIHSAIPLSFFGALAFRCLDKHGRDQVLCSCHHVTVRSRAFLSFILSRTQSHTLSTLANSCSPRRVFPTPRCAVNTPLPSLPSLLLVLLWPLNIPYSVRSYNLYYTLRHLFAVWRTAYLNLVCWNH